MKKIHLIHKWKYSPQTETFKLYGKKESTITRPKYRECTVCGKKQEAHTSYFSATWNDVI